MLSIVLWPDPALQQVAKKVENIEEAKEVGEQMLQVLKESGGVGLAGNQVGVLQRIFVVSVREDQATWSKKGFISWMTPTVCINPEIKTEGKAEPYHEGCLSQPGVAVVVKRPELATLTYVNTEGVAVMVKGCGLLARVWQHEIDHLNGINIGKRRS